MGVRTSRKIGSNRKRTANGVESSYHHLSRVDVENGERLAAGDMLGVVGNTGLSTGPHLHFEITEYGNPVDPVEYGFAAN